MDHEVSRRRECINAVSDLSAAIISSAIEFSSFIDYLNNLPTTFDPTSPREDGVPPERPGETFASEIGRRWETFYDRWFGVIQPPLFVALAILHGTDMYDAVREINEGINKMSGKDTEGGFIDVRKAIFDERGIIGHRPDTSRLTAMWGDIAGRRYDHLLLAQKHFGLEIENF